MAAMYELVHRLGKDYEKPQWGLNQTKVNGKLVNVSERTAMQKSFCNLIHFQRDGGSTTQDDPRILLVAPLSGHHATLLRATVRALLPSHDVYVTDWLDARMVPASAGSFTLNAYVRYVQDFIKSDE